MANPSVYDVEYSFANFHASAPATPLPGAKVDTELANIATAISGLVDAVKDVRRSDGALKNGSVTLESLSVGVVAGLSDLDADAAANLDAAIAAVQTSLDEDIAEINAAKANNVHTHTASQVSVSTIAGISGTDLQAVLAELRAFAPRTGDVRFGIDDTVLSGWIACDDGTIGTTGSAATNRANADTWPLYNLLWTKVSDTHAPVTGGRGLSAALDFAALKPMALTKMLGRTLAVAGSGSGLTARAVGEPVGTESVTLPRSSLANVSLSVNMPADQLPFLTDVAGVQTLLFSPGGSGPPLGGVTKTTNSSAKTGTTASINGGVTQTAVDKMQPTAFLRAFIKL